MAEINYAAIEKKWQARWEKEQAFKAHDNSKKEKYYVLEMFAYPSGAGLHMGHAWNFTLGDIISRYKIMKGYNVLHPVGYDSFGLPAENAAIKEGTHPKDYTEKSMKNFSKQQKALGITYDWERLFATSEPEYSRWDQWIFLQLLNKGLAYQKESAVNWCPKCDTVLANEQVQNGVCWRHEDTKVETKKLKQWFLKTTKYADELFEGIDKLTDWPERTKSMQKNWIGKSYGTEILFDINGETWPIFTTRPDTIFGATFMVVSAQHPRLDELVTEKQRTAVDTFLQKITSVSEKDLNTLEKEGVFTGSYATNPATNEQIPVYAGNFVVADYGSGMVMSVPAHDQRDYEFAKKYDIAIKPVIKGEITEKRAYTEEGVLINSGEFDGIPSKDAITKISNWLAEKGLATRKINFKLRDWGISRQRYWGTPIPVIHCEKCGVIPVPEKDLPVTLPEKVDFGKGNPLETNDLWLNVDCPQCDGPAKRESDTMDTFVNSSWYFLRFCDPHNKRKIFDRKKANYFCPIDTYIGGAEHACMHLIYVRFYTKFLRDLGLINFDEPAKRLFHQGFIHGSDGFKMSKSRGNVIEPLDIIKKYGSDTLRFFMVSVASPDKDFDWDEKGFSGSSKFLRKIFTFTQQKDFGKTNEEVETKLNTTIKNVGSYYDTFDYRKATIELRELFDMMERNGTSKKDFITFLKLLNPICPHITEELHEQLGEQHLLSTSTWPEHKKVNHQERKKEDLNHKVVTMIKEVLKKNKKAKHVYIYTMPFELDKLNSDAIAKKLGITVKVYTVNDNKKKDPEGKAKKAKPGKPSFYLA